MKLQAFLFFVCLAACAPVPGPASSTATLLPAPFVAVTRALTPSAPVSTPAAVISASSTPTATLFPLPSADPQLRSCNQRKPAGDDLLVIITDSFGISSEFTPKDLVYLNSFFPNTQLDFPQVRVRRLMAEPLVRMIKDMRAAGLKPVVRSGFRSYNDQVAAYQRWKQEKPDSAEYLSANPGHSEHQLGLAVDFYSPELPELVGDPTVVYHALFAETSEGKWLAENAYQYGFSLSYPLDSKTWTGFLYEPWHYRYVGVELATYLHESHQFLTKFLMEARPGLPCAP